MLPSGGSEAQLTAYAAPSGGSAADSDGSLATSRRTARNRLLRDPASEGQLRDARRGRFLGTSVPAEQSRVPLEMRACIGQWHASAGGAWERLQARHEGRKLRPQNPPNRCHVIDLAAPLGRQTRRSGGGGCPDDGLPRRRRRQRARARAGTRARTSPGRRRRLRPAVPTRTRPPRIATATFPGGIACDPSPPGRDAPRRRRRSTRSATRTATMQRSPCTCAPRLRRGGGTSRARSRSSKEARLGSRKTRTSASPCRARSRMTSTPPTGTARRTLCATRCGTWTRWNAPRAAQGRFARRPNR